MNDKNKYLELLAITCIAIGVIIGLIFCIRLGCYYKPLNGPIDMPITGQVGDFVGGIIGTLFGLSGTILIYVAYRNQKEELSTTQNLLKNQELNQFFDLWTSIYLRFSSDAVMKKKDNTEVKSLLNITSEFKKLNQFTANNYTKIVISQDELASHLINSYVETIKNSHENHPLLKKWIYLINSAIKRIQHAEKQNINIDSYFEILCSLITWDEMELLRNFTKVQKASHEAHINKEVKETFSYFSNKYNNITRPQISIH